MSRDRRCARRAAGRRRRPGPAQRRQPLRPADLRRPAARRLGGARAAPSPGRGRAPTPPPARRWPAPSPRVPDGAVVLLDGLVACGVPEVVVPAGAPAAAGRAGAPAARRRGGRAARRWPPSSGRPCTPRRRGRRPARGRRAGWSTAHGLPPDRVHVAAPGIDPAPPAAGTDGARRPAVRRRRSPRPRARTCWSTPSPLATDRPALDAATCVGPLRRDPGVRRRGCGARSQRHGLERPGPADRPAAPAPALDATRTPPPTCWCCRPAPRPTAWSSPRRWPGACRCSPRPSAGCPRRSAATRRRRRARASWCHRITRLRWPPDCAAGSMSRIFGRGCGSPPGSGATR